MHEFSLSEKENLEKLKSMFQCCSQDGKKLKPIVHDHLS
jgi:hypothetical protein